MGREDETPGRVRGSAGRARMLKGKVKRLKNKVKEAVGKLTDDAVAGQGPGAQADAMGDVILLDSWMGGIPDDVLVTALNIPGTHNSGCVDGPLGFAKTQNLDISRQLEAGIRFLDIRLAHYQDDLFIHHDVMYMGKSYRDVLEICSKFLARNPSEVIMMSIKEEERADDSLGKFAPSNLVARLMRGESGSRGNARSFSDEFVAQTREYAGGAPLFHNVTTLSPGGPAFTSATTLGDVRGRIILLRRFPGGCGMGFDVTYWLENNVTRSNEDGHGNPRSAVPPIYCIEDHYDNPDVKYGLVVQHIEKARSGDSKDLYITFSSAVSLRAEGYSKIINPQLDDYFSASSKGRVGIVVMDYFDEPRELVSNVIRTNLWLPVGAV